MVLKGFLFSILRGGPVLAQKNRAVRCFSVVVRTGPAGPLWEDLKKQGPFVH